MRRLGLSPSEHSEKVAGPWAPSLYDSWELHQTLRSDACEGVSHLAADAAGQHVQVGATSSAAEATEP
ncbi:Rnf13, partial [Symbiodinium necroappetens]